MQANLSYDGYRLEHSLIFMLIITFMGCLVEGCGKQPPTQRPNVTLPIYSQGNAIQGEQDYNKHCGNCHKLQVGSNEKAPQLSRIYGAKAGLLTEYQYTDALKNANITWTTDEIDKYITDPKTAIIGTKMKSDPVNDPAQRQNIIAYLSTLR